MSVYYEWKGLVNSQALDYFNHCRPSAVLGMLQEAAALASLELGIDRDRVIENYNVFWMLARMWYRLDRPLRWEEPVTVRTWHRGGKGAAMYRDFDLLVDGQPVGEAVSTWVLADMDTHKLCRLSQIGELSHTSGGELCKEKLLTKIRPPEGLTLAEKRLMHYSDTDMNRHVNNIHYADFACDALRLERLGEGKFVSAFQVGYLDECHPGEVLDLYTAEGEGKHFVRGLGEDGRARFDAAVELSALPGEK